MAKKQGKVKTISVKEVTEGMQVLTKFGIGHIVKIEDGFTYINSPLRATSIYRIGELKTLVVEYEEYDYLEQQDVIIDPPKITLLQLPLKYSQWQSAIDNNEVDTDKVVEFEIIDKPSRNEFHSNMDFKIMKDSIKDGFEYPKYAKIIPKKKRMYNEEEVINLLSKHFVDAGSKVGLGNDVTEFTKSWIKDNLK